MLYHSLKFIISVLSMSCTLLIHWTLHHKHQRLSLEEALENIRHHRPLWDLQTPCEVLQIRSLENQISLLLNRLVKPAEPPECRSPPQTSSFTPSMPPTWSLLQVPGLLPRKDVLYPSAISTTAPSFHMHLHMVLLLPLCTSLLFLPCGLFFCCKIGVKKPGMDSDDLNNYWSISSPSFLSKILEGAVNTKLYQRTVAYMHSN